VCSLLIPFDDEKWPRVGSARLALAKLVRCRSFSDRVPAYPGNPTLSPDTITSSSRGVTLPLEINGVDDPELLVP